MARRRPTRRLHVDQVRLGVPLGRLRYGRLHSRGLDPIAVKLALPFDLVADAVLLLLVPLHVVLGRGEPARRLPQADVIRALPHALIRSRRRYLPKLARRQEMLPHLFTLGADIADELLLAIVAAEMDGPIT